MDTAEIRRRFLAHFEAAGHAVVPSASTLADDPNLLFVNAGMVPFKPYFLGQETPPFDRATSVQKCIRTPDIEDVGKTTRHATFFEMCGNFSFGDYFKEGAIQLAWDLITKPVADGGYALDKDRLYPSVLVGDDEAIALWMKVTGLPRERIVQLGPKENYWSMGVPGPGGPCSEILFDRGPDFGPDFDAATLGPDMPVELEDRLLEIWNLVFMQDDLSAVRSKSDFDIAGSLPKKNIDTGMGLDRVALLLQGKKNMYEIDIVHPVIARAEQLTGKTYGADRTNADDIRFSVVADHVRSAMMLIGDGVTPGNDGRGYVLRRLLRRAVRSMRLLGCEDRVLPELMPVSRDAMSPTYPNLVTDWERIAQVAFAEEDAFRKTLQTGEQVALRVVESAQVTKMVTAQDAFTMHDTYGYPIDLTLEMAAEHGLQVDQQGFIDLMAEQRDRAKADARSKKGTHGDTAVYRGIFDTHGPTEWLAYETLETESRPLALLSRGEAVPRLVEGEIGELVLDRTPFYAESGGQVADAGTIIVDGGKLEVIDVQRPIKGLVVHQVRVVEGELDATREVHARVDPEWRIGARQAHSGTHVVHAALREVLGPTALQSGSYNRPGYLRLDFGWTQALSPEQVRDIELVSQQALRADLAVGWDYMTLEQAKEWGAIALFGETYDNTQVRVVEIGGPWSRELCGGTHVDHSSQIGTVVVTGEASVGSGNRRIEALTGVEGFGYLARERDVVAQLTSLLKTQPDDLVGRVQGLAERLRAAEKELEKARLAQLLGASAELAAGASQVGPVKVVAHRADGAGGADVRNLALDVRGRLPRGEPGVVVIIGQADGKVSVVAATNDEARSRGLSAGELVRALGPLLGGKGGGKDDVAQGGGSDASRIDEALALVTTEVARATTQG
ncbi:alanine--tRNA ligase [Nocardioides zhouii]|uniref:Alanine--tRNA ligase n=1 Tax=Nocardioides zhouii TaxID=1168729 RepID=A0A4Q2T6W1_9ACTN|nr:alanine--tRNA ligase [Nocardioides zhouii]RYC13821.1 alanine--tRNA ligase [Nocardioides zhouii]